MTIDDLKNKRRRPNASRTSAVTSDPTGKPTQSTAERRRFVRKLFDLAKGTIEPVRRIVAEGDVVFAVWRDHAEEYGVGCLAVKGAKLLKEIAANPTQVASISAVNCIRAEQAVPLVVIGIRIEHQMTRASEGAWNSCPPSR